MLHPRHRKITFLTKIFLLLEPSPPATRYSLSSTQPSLTPGNQSPQTCPKSLFNRIRKNSLLSATCSPSPTADREQSRTFSFDDILRRVHSSKRNRSSSNNPSTRLV